MPASDSTKELDRLFDALIDTGQPVAKDVILILEREGFFRGRKAKHVMVGLIYAAGVLGASRDVDVRPLLEAIPIILAAGAADFRVTSETAARPPADTQE